MDSQLSSTGIERASLQDSPRVLNERPNEQTGAEDEALRRYLTEALGHNAGERMQEDVDEKEKRVRHEEEMEDRKIVESAKRKSLEEVTSDRVLSPRHNVDRSDDTTEIKGLPPHHLLPSPHLLSWGGVGQLHRTL